MIISLYKIIVVDWQRVTAKEVKESTKRTRRTNTMGLLLLFLFIFLSLMCSGILCHRYQRINLSSNKLSSLEGGVKVDAS